MKLCKGCMEHYSDDLKVCPHCGYENGSPPKNPLHMMPGSLLADRYIVGKVLGFGGFGVTYIAWDGLLQTKVAIKEYFPSDLSTRTLGETQIVVYGDEKKQRYGEGMKKFVNEAKKLAKFNTTEGIVKIFDAFESNNTAYIVMELLEGETIEEFLKREKKVSAEEAVRLMMPVLESLQKVHDAGIVHRDISPDNLIITKNQNVQILAETIIPVNDCILSKTTEFYSITGLIANPNALAKCKTFIKEEMPRQLNLVIAESMDESARLLNNYNLTYSIIGTPKTAEIYNLNILKEHIEEISEKVLKETKGVPFIMPFTFGEYGYEEHSSNICYNQDILDYSCGSIISNTNNNIFRCMLWTYTQSVSLGIVK